MQSPEIDKIAFALAKFQGMVDAIPKNKTVSTGTFKYTYADLASIWENIRHPLTANELAISQGFSYRDGKYFIDTMLLHSSGQWLKSSLEIGSHEKIQQLGSEITYLRRYSLSAILGISTDEDDDAQAANEDNRFATKKPGGKQEIFTQSKREEEPIFRTYEDLRSELLKKVKLSDNGEFLPLYLEKMKVYYGDDTKEDILTKALLNVAKFANNYESIRAKELEKKAQKEDKKVVNS